MAILMGIVGFMALINKDLILLLFIQLFLFTYQATQGSFTFVYLGQVCSDTGLSLGTMSLWLSVLIISIITGPLFESGLGSAGTFWLFGVLTLIGFVLLLFTIKDTQGLTRD